MQQEHAGDKIILERRCQYPFAVRCFQAHVDQPLQRGAMQLNHRLDQLQGSSPDFRVAALVELGCQFFYVFTLGAELSAPRCSDRLFRAGRHYSGPAAPNMGECFTSITLPSPTYMCTPQGRQGSKLRTVRMMSMPLKFSGPLSSKMGVFCTASS